MSKLINDLPTIKNLKKAIREKAENRNRELNKDFYSNNPDDYEFVDINSYDSFKLLLFRCPKSKSTVSIKIQGEH